MRLYDSARLAASYAFDRPRVHQRILERVASRLGNTTKVRRALDIGCGAGLSTAALDAIAGAAVGLEPMLSMMRHSGDVAPRARFVAAQAERLPFASGTFGLLTAAGALNYVDLDLFFPEARRVLAPEGVLVIYDFAAGRRLRDSDALRAWYDAFEQRYPASPGYYLDVKNLAYDTAGLQLTSYDSFDVAVPMTLTSYLRYVLGETRVELALARGLPDEEIREWCRRTLREIFGGGARDVLFDAYAACVRRSATV